MRRFAHCLSPGLGLALALTGCVRAPTTMSSMPSSLYVRQICPAATWEIVGELDEHWTGWGFFGFPFSSGPPVATWVNDKVKELEGDAVMDLMVRTDIRQYPYTALPGYYVTAKVIRFEDTRCHPERPAREPVAQDEAA